MVFERDGGCRQDEDEVVLSYSSEIIGLLYRSLILQESHFTGRMSFHKEVDMTQKWKHSLQCMDIAQSGICKRPRRSSEKVVNFSNTFTTSFTSSSLRHQRIACTAEHVLAQDDMPASTTMG